jgi:hypothetical protein
MKTKNLIAALLFAAGSAFAQVPSYVPTNGLVGWWPFNGNANDESGNGNNGTVTNATLAQDRFGNASSAYLFTGAGTSRVTVNDNPSIRPSNNMTVCAWINVTGPTMWNNVLSKRIVATNQNSYILYEDLSQNANIPYQTFNFGLTTGSTPTGFSGYRDSVLNNTWHLLVGTYDGSTAKFYQDGILKSQYNISGNITYSNDPLYIGANGYPVGQGFIGYVDDVGLWNRALTQQEITALYNAQTCIISSNTITADGPTTFCAGNSVNLKSDVVGGTYQWKKNGVNVSSNGTSRTYKATATGSYTCVATCNGTALTSNAIQVTSKTNAAVNVTATGATSFCVGDSVTLNCTNLGSNYSVQWYRTNISIENATNYTQVVKQPGTYKVVSKNLTTGCSRISSSSVVVAVNCRLANPDVVAVDITESDFDAATREAESKGKIYIYPNPTSDNKFTVELMGLDLNGDATLEVYNAMGQVLSSEIVNITNGSLNRTIQIDEQSKGQLCLVRLIAGSEVYDSKVIIK